jgi:hypothetical protein
MRRMVHGLSTRFSRDRDRHLITLVTAIFSRASEKWGQRSSELRLGLDEAKRLSGAAPPVSLYALYSYILE